VNPKRDEWMREGKDLVESDERGKIEESNKDRYIGKRCLCHL
jgi:hypothetical protein